MYIYVIATVISVVFAYRSTKTQNRYVKIALQILSFAPLFIVSAVRYNVGTDFPETYTKRFLWRANQGADISAAFEIGFVKIIDFILLFSKNPQWLFAVCSLIFVGLTFIAVYQQSNNPTYSILLLVIGCHYFISLNLMRNFVAISIFIYAFKYIKERKLIKYSIFMLLASSIHMSMLIFFPLYFLYNERKCGVKTTAILSIGTIVLLPILKISFQYIIQYTDYGIYYETQQYSSAIFLTSLFIINLMLLIMFLKNYKENQEDKLYNFYIKIELISFLITILSLILPMARRLILGFNFVQILSIPYILGKEKNAKVRLVLNALIIAIFTFYTYREIAILGSHEVLPYQTIFDK